MSTKLDVKAFALSAGILWGLGMLIIGLADISTTWADAFGAVMSTVYIGYAPTLIGSIIGGIWGFLDAAIGAMIFAWLYNLLAKK
ncbi:MAG: bacteriophage holin [Candidatus Margulisiibacteriota bacterium]|jgi:hypothetical protein